MLSLDKIHEKFQEFEVKHDLFNRKIKGHYFWELIRFRVSELIYQKNGIIVLLYPDFPSSKREKTKFLLNSIFNLKKNPYFTRRKTIFAFGSGRRIREEDGNYWDIYFDYFLDELDFNYILYEEPSIYYHASPVKTKNIRYADFINVLSNLYLKLVIKTFEFDVKEERFIHKLERKLYKEFDVVFNLKPLIKHYILRYYSNYLFIRLLFKIVKPKVVLLTCSYGKESIMQICEKLNIPTVELQHGLINKYHYGYSFPQSIEKKTFPNFFLTYSDYWKSIISITEKIRSRTFSTGFPFFENQKNLLSKIEKKKIILFISDGTGRTQLSEFAVRLSTSKDLDYKIVYKMHPHEYGRWEKLYPSLKDTNIEVKADNSVNIYKLFAESMVQIGTYSTAIYEGLSFGLRTYILEMPGFENLNDLLESKTITKIHKVEELINDLKINIKGPKVNFETFFRLESVDHMKSKLTEIIERNSKR